MKFKLYFLCALLFLTSKSIQGQQPPSDPIGDSFFAPELVMQHQEEIKLTDDQKNFLKTELRKVQMRFTELQWKLQDESEKMVALVKQQHIDEQQTLAQLDKILDAEREIKRLQIALIVKIKNSLTAEQQARLQEIKNKAREK